MGDTFIVLCGHLWSQLVGYYLICILFNILDIARIGYGIFREKTQFCQL